MSMRVEDGHPSDKVSCTLSGKSGWAWAIKTAFGRTRTGNNDLEYITTVFNNALSGMEKERDNRIARAEQKLAATKEANNEEAKREYEIAYTQAWTWYERNRDVAMTTYDRRRQAIGDKFKRDMYSLMTMFGGVRANETPDQVYRKLQAEINETFEEERKRSEVTSRKLEVRDKMMREMLKKELRNVRARKCRK